MLTVLDLIFHDFVDWSTCEPLLSKKVWKWAENCIIRNLICW